MTDREVLRTLISMLGDDATKDKALKVAILRMLDGVERKDPPHQRNRNLPRQQNAGAVSHLISAKLLRVIRLGAALPG